MVAGPKNLGIAVADAKRLNDCYRELSEALAARPEGDQPHWSSGRSSSVDSAEMGDWVHRGNSQNVAEACIRVALSDGALPAWVRREDGESKVDRFALKELNHRTFAAGAYLPDNDRDSDLVHRPLWVKNADWRSFFGHTLKDRYGESGAQADPPVEPNAVIVMPLPDGWGSADCVELPPWLNMYQLVAWVQYRDLSIVAKADSWNGLAAQHTYGSEQQVGKIVDLERALQEGRLVAFGLKRGEVFAPIPAVEWTRIRLTPFDLAHQHPYIFIQVKREDALAIFPAGMSADSPANQEASMPAGGESKLRAPAVKAGRPPGPEAILAKADEMKAGGLDSYRIASQMRHQVGFENVATTEVRELIKGRWKPSGRPKRKGA